MNLVIDKYQCLDDQERHWLLQFLEQMQSLIEGRGVHRLGYVVVSRKVKVNVVFQ